MKIGLTVFITLLIALIISSGCNQNNDPVRPPNNPPEIERFWAQYNTLEWGGATRLWVTAYDPEEAELTYSWTTTGGQFTSAVNANSVTWQAPNESGSFSITVTVSDEDNSVTDTDTITVVANPVLLIGEDFLRFNSSTDTLRFDINNSRTGQLDWTLTTSTDDGGEWLNLLSEASGATIGGESSEAVLAVDRSVLSGGSYFGWVRVASNGGNDSVRITLAVAEISVNTAMLDFGNDVNTLSFTVSNIGEGSLNWTASENEDWIEVAPVSGVVVDNPDEVVVAVNRDGIDGGTFNRPITITSNGGNAQVNVRMTVEPVLSLDPMSLDFGGEDRRTLNITNSGIGRLAWEIVEDEEWLNVAQDAGSTESGQTDNVVFTVDRTGLDNGVYNTEALIASNGGDEVIHISMNVGPVLALSPDSLGFGTLRDTQPLSIWNVGTSDMTWSITEDVDWLDVSPMSGVATTERDEVTLTVNRDGLEENSYMGFLTVECEETGERKNVIVSLTIAEPMLLQYDDNSSENGLSMNDLWWFMVRFTRPEGWDAATVTEVRILMSSGNQEFNIEGVDGAEPVIENEQIIAYIPPRTAPTALLRNQTQEPGWATYNVEQTYTQEQFCVGVLFTNPPGPYIGSDLNGQIFLRSVRRNQAGDVRQYFTDVNWIIRVWVVPQAGANRSEGMWLDATAGPVPAAGHSSMYSVSIKDLQNEILDDK